jgi:cell division septum initiation protein DivIVA
MTSEEIEQLRQRIAVGETMLNPDAILDALEDAHKTIEFAEDCLEACKRNGAAVLARAEKAELALAAEREMHANAVRTLETMVGSRERDLAAADREHAAYQQHMVSEFAKQEARAKELRGQLDAALAQRDEARRLYCTLAHDAAVERAKGYEPEINVRPESPREIAISHWPADADGLFPSAECEKETK